MPVVAAVDVKIIHPTQTQQVRVALAGVVLDQLATRQLHLARPTRAVVAVAADSTEHHSETAAQAAPASSS